MIPSSDKAERRSTERSACSPAALCRIIDPLEETALPAAPWNVSSSGVCVLIEPHYAPGTHLELDIRGLRNGLRHVVFGEVVHSILVPSFQEMWLTGCSFRGERGGA